MKNNVKIKKFKLANSILGRGEGIKNKNAFTLIELLAIIVILAIIAVITVPIILDVIDNSKKGAAKDSAYGFKDAVNKYYVSELYDNQNLKLNGDYTITDKGELSDGTKTYPIPFSGNAPTGGSLTYENNVLKNGCITIDEYKATIENGEVTTVEKGSCEGSLVKTGPTSEDPDTTKTKGLLKIVYLDPTDLNKTCTKEMAESNVNEFGTPTGIKSGCMKWYTYKDDGENYTMILDHNTSPHYAWITTNDCSKNNPDNTFCSLLGPISAINKLNSDTENWKYSARLISANEIADLTGASKILDWSADKEFIYTPIVGSSISYYYFDGEDSDDAIWQTKISLTKGANKYSWLFDNTFNCLNNGCNVSDDYEYEYEEEKKLYTFGYWTSDRVNSSNSDIAWWVSNYGEMDYTSTVTANYRVGLRPVIVVPKEDIDY